MNLKIKYPSVEKAWQSYRDLVLANRISDDQRTECRLAFWAGASVLFNIMINMLDDDHEPTAADLAKMDVLNNEIDKFCKTFDAEIMKRHGGQQ